MSYPRNHASSLAASSGDCYAQDNAIGGNSSTNPSEEVLPQLNTHASNEQGLEQKDDDTEELTMEARAVKFIPIA